MELIGTGSQRAGKASRVAIGNTPLAFASWETNLNGEDYPTVNFNSYILASDTSFDEGILGPVGADIRFGGDWDAGANPYDNPPGLYPRNDLEDVDLYENLGDNVGWEFPYMRVRTSTNSAEVHNKVLFNVGGKNQGPFTYPTGSV